MKAIWKYPLKMVDLQIVELPLGSTIVSTGFDPSRQLCIWATVDPEEKQTFGYPVFILGTGHSMPDDIDHPNARFIGTAVDETFVWHVFTRTR